VRPSRPKVPSRPFSRLSSYFLTLALGLIAFAGVQTPADAQISIVPPILLLQASVEKPYALLFVTVWGPDNRAVYGVKVRIRRADQKKPHWELYSDRRGEAAQRLPPGPGDYIISADPKGVKDASGRELEPGEDVNVHFDKEERQDIGLRLK
jgi:hypothetical protein